MNKNFQLQHYVAICVLRGKLRIFCLLFLLVVFGGANIFSQSALMSWDFTGKGGQSSVPTSIVASGVSTASPSSVASLGAGLAASNYLSNGLTATQQTQTTLANAITGNDYIAFTIIPVSGKSVSVTDIKLRPVSQNRARSFAVFSSKNGFAAANVINTITANGNNNLPLQTVTITGHTNITTATEFRVYIYGYTDNYEAVGLGNRQSGLVENDLLIDGTVNNATDTQAPYVPTGLSSASITQTSFTLNWAASTDNVGVTGYDVFKNGTLLGSTTSATISNVTGLTASTTYTMTVKAKDAAGNVSAASTPLNVTTSGASGTWTIVDHANAAIAYTGTSWVNSGTYHETNCTTAYLQYTFTGTGIKWTSDLLPWGASAGIYIDNVFQQTVSCYSATQQQNVDVYVNSSLSNASHTIKIIADGTCNYVRVRSLSYFSGSGSGDSQAPSVPTGLSSTSVTTSSFTLNWTASTDNVGVTGYEVFSNGASISTPASTSLSVTGLTCNTAYSMTVRARDAAGNWSAQSSALNVTTSTCPVTPKVNHIGINIGGSSLDFNADKPWADAMRSHRNSFSTGTKDSNYWLTQDGQYLVWAGLNTMNNNGTYKLYFTGQATLTTSDATVQNLVYNSSTNTSTADVIISDVNNGQMYLTFSNTKLTATSTTNTGVTNIQLMRPVTAGSTTSYPQSQLFTNQFLAAIAPFEAIRFMDWTSTNACGDSLWVDRTLWSHASQCPPNLPNRSYGWQGRGSSWESVIKMSNLTNKDAWIDIPHKATDDYITKLAQLFKYGSDANGNVYTSTQSNPINAPLNSNLHLYVEYSNEVWNWGGAFLQTPWVRDRGKVFGAPLNYDGNADEGTLMYRYKAMRTVQMSTIFRSVFGDAAMMTQVRPVMEWQQNYNDLVSRTLNFIDKWYNKRDSRSTVVTPHPINYYLYGGGGSTYWAPNDPNVTINNAWTTGYMLASNWLSTSKINDANWATANGLKNMAYEGGAIEEYDIPAATKDAICSDSRMRANYNEHQKAWNQMDGELNMYFNLSSGSVGGPSLAILQYVDQLTTAKWYAIQDMKTATPDAVSLGSTAPFTRPGAAFDISTYETPNPNGSGSATLTSNSDGFALGYCFKVPSNGTYNVQIQYSTNAAATLAVDFAGNAIGTFPLASTGGATTNTAYMNINCNANTLYGIRCIATSGTVTIVNVVVGTGRMSAPAFRTGIDSENMSKLLVYPNPIKAGDFLTISNLSGGKPAIIQILDLSGKVLRNEKTTLNEKSFQLNTVGLSKGVYIMQIRNEEIANQRLIIE